MQVPVLVLRGECDYTAWEVTREYRDILPNATLLAIDGAGHVIAADRPDLYHQAVTAFSWTPSFPSRRTPPTTRRGPDESGWARRTLDLGQSQLAVVAIQSGLTVPE